MIVSGSILDDQMGIIPYANVVVVDENRSITADKDGKFSIQVNSQNSILQFSHAGYDYDTITVSEFNNLGYINLYSASLEPVNVTNNYKSSKVALIALGIGALIILANTLRKRTPKPIKIKA